MMEKEEATLAAQAETFIGSFVSLLTNSNIRYHGFVFYLNPKHSTIGIRIQKRVKSSGTEGQRKDSSQVPPSEGIYEYLYFKGNEIKGLDVKSPRPAQTTLNVLDDPAIIQGLDVKSPHPAQSMHNVLDDPAIIQYLSSPPASTSVSLSSSGALQMTNVSHNVQSAVNVPYFRGPGVQNGLHASQKSPVCSSSGIPSMPAPSARGSQNDFPPISPGVQNGLFLVPQISTIDSPSSVLPSSATSSQNGFPPVPPVSATHSLISPLTPGSQSGLRPANPLLVTGSLEDLHSPPSSSAAVNGFSLATPSPAAHSDARLFSLPAFSLPPSLPSNSTFSGPSMPADLKTQVASSSSTSPLLDTDTASVEEADTSVPGPDAPSSSMLLSVMPTAETRSSFPENDPTQPSDPLLQQEQIRLSSYHDDYGPVRVSASVTLSSGSENVKEPLLQIVKPQANKPISPTISGIRRGLNDKDVFQDHPSNQGHGNGRPKLPNGAGLHAQYHAKARGYEKGRDGLHGARSHHGYEKSREYLPNRGVLHGRCGYRSHAKVRGHEALHPVEKFTEDFNFEAMFEKFNKEEVWGLFGESTAAISEHKNVDGTDTNIGDAPEAEEDGPVKFDNTPVYCKDDFFDTLSSNTLDQQSGRWRVKFYERRKLDSETFGEIQKHQQGRGIHGPRRVGGSQGSYRGRGYDHRGRGRGRTVYSRVT